MILLKPARLAPGDAIGVMSPASPVAAFCPRRFERGVANLGALGFEVVVGAHARARHGHTAGTVAERVADLHGFFRDPAIKAVITTIGGFNANQLLDRLDYDLIRANPKILMGYSDVTALLAGIHQQTGLVTFLGPAIMPQFGEADGLHAYSTGWFRQVLLDGAAPLVLTPSGISVHERLAWDQADTRPRVAVPDPGPKVLRPGRAEGPIVAGNLGTLLGILGSPYFPDLDGVVLCVEEDESETPATVDRFFTQLRLMGAFARIAALVVGRFHPEVGFGPDDPLEALVMQATEGFELPVAIGFDFGHTDPMLVLPYGVRAEVDFGAGARLTLLEAGVV